MSPFLPRLQDTVGVAHVELPFDYMTAGRPGGGGPDGTIGLSPNPRVDIVVPDSTCTTCTTTIQHMTGYQERFGGDTTRISALDSLPGWQLYMYVSPLSAVLVTGETVTARPFYVHGIPDTLDPGRTLEMDVTFDFNGLFYWEYGVAGRYLRLDSSHINVHQVR